MNVGDSFLPVLTAKEYKLAVKYTFSSDSWCRCYDRHLERADRTTWIRSIVTEEFIWAYHADEPSGLFLYPTRAVPSEAISFSAGTCVKIIASEEELNAICLDEDWCEARAVIDHVAPADLRVYVVWTDSIGSLRCGWVRLWMITTTHTFLGRRGGRGERHVTYRANG